MISDQIHSMQRTVRFAAHDDVFEIPHVNDMSDDEVDAVYMSPKELDAIRSECKILVGMMDEGLHLTPDGKEQFCTRGLEHHTKLHTRRVDEIRDNIYDSVYAMQTFQVTSSQDVTELLASLCQRYSALSTQNALATAKADARSASRVQRRKPESKTIKRKQISPVKATKFSSPRIQFSGAFPSNLAFHSETNPADIISQALDLTCQ